MLTGWDLVFHVAERSVYHIVGGMALMPILQAVWFECRRKGWVPRLRGATFALVPAVIVLAFVAIREPWDASRLENHWWKSWIDYSTWAFGLVLMVWLQIRYRERNMQWTLAAQKQLGRWIP